MLCDSVVAIAVVAVVMCTRPRAKPLAMITVRKSTRGFSFLSYMSMGLCLAALCAARAPLLIVSILVLMVFIYKVSNSYRVQLSHDLHKKLYNKKFLKWHQNHTRTWTLLPRHLVNLEVKSSGNRKAWFGEKISPGIKKQCLGLILMLLCYWNCRQCRLLNKVFVTVVLRCQYSDTLGSYLMSMSFVVHRRSGAEL